MSDVGPIAAALGVVRRRHRGAAADPARRGTRSIRDGSRWGSRTAGWRSRHGDARATATWPRRPSPTRWTCWIRSTRTASRIWPYLRAVVWLNLANLRALQASDDAHAAARDAARARHRRRGRRSRRGDINAAAAGLQARHVLCRVCAHSLSQAGDEEMPEDVHEATDAVDDGLELVRSWEQRGVAALPAAGLRSVSLRRPRVRALPAAVPRRVHRRQHEPRGVVARLRRTAPRWRWPPTRRGC